MTLVSTLNGTGRGTGAGWPQAVVAIAVSWLLAGWLLDDTVVDLVGVWYHNSTYNYCFLVPVISAWIAWDRRATLERVAPRPSVLGVVAAMGFAVAWLAAEAAEISLGRHIALIGIAQSLVLAIIGVQATWALLFPILFLWLAVPTGEGLSLPLQYLTADYSTRLIELTGIAVLREGLVIDVPSGRYVVADVCSGLNFLLASLALSLVYANLIYVRWWKRALCVAIGLAVAIVANWIRVWAIIVFNHFTGGGIDIAGDHLTWGWGFFAAVMFGAIYGGLPFRDGEPDRSAPRRRTAGAPIGRTIVTSAVALAVIAGPVGYAGYADRAQPAAIPPAALAPPTAWSPTSASQPWRPEIGGADMAERLDLLAPDGQPAIAIRAWFAKEAPGRKLIGYNTRIFDEQSARLIRQYSARAPIGGDGTVRSAEAAIQGAGWLVWHWYELDGQAPTASALRAKLRMAAARLTLRPQGGALVLLATPVGDDIGAAAKRLADLAAALRP